MQGRLILHGNGTNRWFDKSVSMVVFANGRAGFNGEHTWADAPVL
ncbi:MAG: choline/carnitine O-acyltransferase, partial [Thiobacillus sp.]